MRKIISIITFLAVITTTSSCAWFKSEAGKTKDALIDCAKQDLGQSVGEAGLSILLTVSGIIFQGDATWQSDLAALEAKYGPEVVACAISISETLFRTPAKAGVGLGAEYESPHDRAASTIRERGWQFKQ